MSRIAFGAWPIAGITSLDVDDQQSVATIRSALDFGVNFIDTAFSYGYDGRSDRLIREAIEGRRDRVVIASKVGTHYNDQKVLVKDGRPERLIRDTEEVLKRLGVSFVELLYLHAPDPTIPIEKSAEALATIQERGLAQEIGVSNVSLEQLKAFHSICEVATVQTYFNVFQRESVAELRQFCEANRITITCYWVLMKGLLAGKLKRDHVFDPKDRRLTYAVYQGDRWAKSQDMLDALRLLSADSGLSVAQLILHWTLAQPEIGVAIVGAKRPAQFLETASVLRSPIDSAILKEVSLIVQRFEKEYSFLPAQ